MPVPRAVNNREGNMSPLESKLSDHNRHEDSDMAEAWEKDLKTNYLKPIGIHKEDINTSH